ncbi:MAPK-activated protein kinase Srk1 [Naganishia onofrii]|uniref:MAPK-activated protein kinase Srk1 n=1 Tax=Naganishia onofrii TaxID=1851511 RepID=A0ACC2XVI0_9TREE|nr:MAPK-activated protein kinase Srk1 [Naganishia onofrii]
MPGGGVVMDAFKNLIRHGKNAQPSPSQQTTQPATSTNSSSRHGQSSVPKNTQASAPSQNQAAGSMHNSYPPAVGVPAKGLAVEPQQTNAPMISPDYQREAEQIVREEREQKERMPQYKGLEGFQLVEKMGDGAFSNVYKAIDKLSGQKVAVKVVRKYELSSSQNGRGDKHLNPNFKQKRPRVTERANILKEVQIMRGTNHPNIIKLISFSESDEHYFLVLELMEGGELFHQIVKLTYFSEDLARHVILQVAHAVRHLHKERGVVHRDIKPENLLFERIPIIPSKHPIQRPYDEEKEDEGEFRPGVGGGGIGLVKLADFGLSKVIWDEVTQTPCGTVGYTAPEIVKDERYSSSVDMWALGCVLYTLLCGFPPFYDESISVLTEKVARGYYTFLSPWWDDISHSAKDLITHLLCVDPRQRYDIDEFLAHPWCNEASAKPQPAPAPQRAPVPSANIPIDSPLLASVRAANREGRSPGLGVLKEAFDVSTAVHRMREEGNGRFGATGAGQRGFLGGLNEEDEEADEEYQLEDARRKHGEVVARTIQQHRAKAASGQDQPGVPAGQHYQGRGGADRRQAEAALYDGRAGTRDRGKGGNRSTFELDLNGSTLLGRRKKPVGESPLSRQPVVTPASPMHY